MKKIILNLLSTLFLIVWSTSIILSSNPTPKQRPKTTPSKTIPKPAPKATPNPTPNTTPNNSYQQLLASRQEEANRWAAHYAAKKAAEQQIGFYR